MDRNDLVEQLMIAAQDWRSARDELADARTLHPDLVRTLDQRLQYAENSLVKAICMVEEHGE